MRLSDVKGERTLHVFAELWTPVVNILRSDEISDMFTGNDGEDEVLDKMRSLMPVLIEAHADEVYQILGTISGKGKDGYIADVNLMTLTADLGELVTDEAFIDFLGSAVRSAGVFSSESDSESTEDH